MRCGSIPPCGCAVAGARGTTPLAEGAHLASQPTLSRLLDILTLEPNRPVLREALAELAARRLRAERGGRRLRHLTIDVDGLPVEVHGAQPGSAWNGHYHQRMYHPIIACAAETGDMLDARLRPGNAHTAEGALDFVLDLVDRLEGTMCQVAMVRMDAGFPEERLLAGLEARGTPYVARLRNNRAARPLAGPHLRRPPGRPPAEPRLWLHEMDYQAGAWSRPRRVVLVVLGAPGRPAARPLLAAHQHRRRRRAGRGPAGPLPPARHRGGPLRRADGRPRARAVLDAAHQAPLPRQPAAGAAHRHRCGRPQRGDAAAAPAGLRTDARRAPRHGDSPPGPAGACAASASACCASAAASCSTPAASPSSSPRPPPGTGPPSGPASSAAPGPAPDATPASKSHHRADRHRHPAGGQFRAAEPRRAMAGSAPAAC